MIRDFLHYDWIFQGIRFDIPFCCIFFFCNVWNNDFKKKIGNENDMKVKLILLGSISLILLQTFIHIGVNIRILPTTGMTLPFLSYGGSSIVSTAILSGIILNLTKRRVK